MNLSNAKKLIFEKVGIPFHFVYKGSRNQIEEFDGIISKCFPSIFLILTTNNTVKSFSYNDYIVKNLKIFSCSQIS